MFPMAMSGGLVFIFNGFSRRNCIFYCCAWILEIIIKNKNILSSIRYKYNLTIANLRIHKKTRCSQCAKKIAVFALPKDQLIDRCWKSSHVNLRLFQKLSLDMANCLVT
jgi:hypothetical protein